ncbi:MAG: hypothetical protein ACRDOA_18450 [Streptosporangiaceae bacterium]
MGPTSSYDDVSGRWNAALSTGAPPDQRQIVQLDGQRRCLVAMSSSVMVHLHGYQAVWALAGAALLL